MKKRLTEIAILQTAKVATVIYAGLGVVVAVVTALLGASAVAALLMLILYPVAGFVVTALVAALYNVIAKQLGGIEFTVIDEPFPAVPGLFPQVPSSTSTGFDEELRQLAKLKEDGLITEEEFTQKKRSLLRL